MKVGDLFLKFHFANKRGRSKNEIEYIGTNL